MYHPSSFQAFSIAEGKAQQAGLKPESVLVPLLISIAKATRQLVSIKLAESGILPGQDQLLCELSEGEPRNIMQIAEALSVRPSTVSKMLDILENKGLASRESNGADKRKVFARLTPEGVGKRDEVRRIWTDLEGELLRGLDGDGMIGTALTSLRATDGVLSRRLSRLR